MLAGALALTLAANAQVDVLPSIPKGTIAINLTPIATGLAAPDYAISAPGDTNRMFVLEQKGQVLVLQNGVLLPTPALDIQSLVAPPLVVTNANDERGLLGMAFHPGFNNPLSPGYRTLYTYDSELIPALTTPTFVAPNGATQGFKNVVNEWQMSAGNPNVVDPASRREVISFGKNANNHNGGTIAFGPDGYMYLGLGDGGNANDVGSSHIEPGGNAQNLSTPLGKMLRFDPVNPSLTIGSPDPLSSNLQYRIPTTNPFQGAGQVREIYAYGLRNPYRFSFDRVNGQLIAADVGQNTVEEIDRITIGGNYGWALKEGDFLFNRTTGPGGAAGTVGVRSAGSPLGLVDPLSGSGGTLEYDHQDGISIIGGLVYRGSLIPELYGKYVFGDLALHTVGGVRIDGRLFYADLDTGVIDEFLLPQFANGFLPNGRTVHGFGEDANGELYALATNTPSSGSGGVIYAIGNVPEPSAVLQLGLAAIGLLGGGRWRSARTARRSAMMQGRLPLLLLGVMGIASGPGSAAWGATISLNPTQDNSIFSEGNNSNALGSLYAGATPSLTVRRALLEFDIAGSLPAGAVINSVLLSLTQTKIGPAGAATFELHPLLAAWGEGGSSGTGAGGAPTTGDATWNFRLYNTNSWSLPGGDFGSTSGTAAFGTSNGIYTFSSQPGLVADVQNWLNTPGTNFGWILRAADESPGVTTARELGSRENPPVQRPTLTVSYTAAPEPGALALLGAAALGAIGQRPSRRRVKASAS